MTTDSLSSNTSHLLYVQVTDICEMNCDFCMYRNNRRGINLVIEGKAKENLTRLVRESSHIGISGEGEPFNNKRAILSLLEMGNGGRIFDLITSANIRPEVLHSFINDAANIVKRNKDKLRIRLSLDRFHLAKLKYFNITSLLKRMIETKEDGSSLELFFRSITIDRKLVTEYLDNLASKEGYKIKWDYTDPLKYEMKIDEHTYFVEFKSIVNKGSSPVRDIYTLEDYIELLENALGRPFTLGYINADGKTGIDITINPDGGIVFYGLECEEIGNIYHDEVRYKNIQNFIYKDPFYSTFIRVPFKHIIAQLRKDKKLSSRIDEINNPYWIVRKLNEECPDLLREKVLSL